jgi:hypothetical protein
MDLERVQWTDDGRFKVALPEEDKRVLIGKTPNPLWIVGGRDELAAVLEGPPKGYHKILDLIWRDIIIWFVPEAAELGIGIDSRKNQRANRETFFAAREIGDW